MQARTSWPAVTAALAAGVVAASYVGKLPPALPALKAEFELSLVAAGWVVSLFNALAAVTGVFFGLLCRSRWRPTHLLRGTHAARRRRRDRSACGRRDQLARLPLRRGRGFISVSVAAAALIFAAAAASDRRIALGIWSAYLPLGFAATIVAAPPLMAIIGWRGLWLGLVALTAASIAALAAQRARYPIPAASSRTFASIVEALRQPGPWWVAGAMGFYTAQWTSVMVWLPTFLVQERSASLFMASVATALAVIANIPGIIAGTWLLGRQVERGPLIAIAASLMGACGVASLSIAPARLAALRVLSRLLVHRRRDSSGGAHIAAAIRAIGRPSRRPARIDHAGIEHRSAHRAARGCGGGLGEPAAGTPRVGSSALPRRARQRAAWR